ncbi:MAG: cell division protein ZapE, partial [Perlucidibaca sp.]
MTEAELIMTPVRRYQEDLARNGFQRDAAQLAAVRALDAVYEALLDRYEKAQTVRGPARLREIKRQKTPAQGLYLWGGVGRGKTYLMDLFFESLPVRRKQRIHFHRFMQHVHRELTALQGVKDPLTAVAERIHKDAVVICFD